MEVTGHKAHGLIPEPGSLVLARVTKVMARMASVDILCVGSKAVREKFAGVIRSFMELLLLFLLVCIISLTCGCGLYAGNKMLEKQRLTKLRFISLSVLVTLLELWLYPFWRCYDFLMLFHGLKRKYIFKIMTSIFFCFHSHILFMLVYSI